MFEITKTTPKPKHLSQEMHESILKNRDILNHLLIYYQEHRRFPKSSKVKGFFGKSRLSSFQQMINLKMIVERNIGIDTLASLSFGGFLYCNDPQANAFKDVMYALYDLMDKNYKKVHEPVELSFDFICKALFQPNYVESQKFLEIAILLLDGSPFSIMSLNRMIDGKGQESVTSIRVVEKIFEFDNADDFFNKCYDAIQSESRPMSLIGNETFRNMESEEPYVIKEEVFESDVISLREQSKCFVIMPIGKKGTVEYLNNIQVFEKIIKPCVEASGYEIECYHADLIGEPGSIPEQIINALRNDEIVIADLRRHNPNVMWELGVRHALLKRSIMVCSDYGQTFFDASAYRVAKYNVDGSSNQTFFTTLRTFIADVVENENKSDNPVWNVLGEQRSVRAGSSEKRDVTAREKMNSDLAKLKMGRAFEDFNSAIATIEKAFPEDSAKLAGQFGARGTASSGIHLKAQMVLALTAKEKSEKEFQMLKRHIEDVLVECSGSPYFSKDDKQFVNEEKQLQSARKRCDTFYDKLNATPKEWESRLFKSSNMTQSFDVNKTV
ncbi:MAG: hypothetical protein V1673_02830 [Candidatus Omnitrophota bacterium]